MRKVADERLLEKIARMIPGYGGYKDKELRREADKLQRMYLSKRLREEESRIQSLGAEMTRQGALELVGEADRIVRRLERTADRLRFGSYGYAGFFDLVKVREDELDRLYEYDASLLSDVDAVGQKVGELESDPGDQAGARKQMKELDKLVAAIDKKLSEREDLLRGLK